MGLSTGAVLLGCLLAVAVQSSLQQASLKRSQTIAFAPEADVINEIDDIDAAGNCMEEVAKYCTDMAAGEGALADCMSDHIADSEQPESDTSISEACREEAFQYHIRRNANINSNIPMARACKIDAVKFCNVTWFFGYKSGQVIACLRDVKDQVAPGCQKQIFKSQQEAAVDIRVDALLYEACKEDVAAMCKDVRPGSGRVQACLRDQRMKLSWGCEEQLFRQDIENSDDIRLSVRLFAKCMPDKKKFCEDVAPGSARVKDCLEANRNAKGFSAECRVEIDAMLESRVKDFRLDSRLRTTCEDDIYNMCALFGDTDSVDTDDSSVIRCLQDFAKEIKNEACKAQVYKYQELAASDVRFDIPLADACFEDRQKLCGDVPPGSAKVIRCMHKKRAQLSSNCRAVLFDEEVRFSENIDFQVPMKNACEEEIHLFCKDVPHGQARVIRCLQENKGERDFGEECRREVVIYESEASTDYRLNFRLNAACATDIAALCKGACKAEEGQVCGGTVLRCLTDNRDLVKSDTCQKEIYYFSKMEVTDFHNDVILATACSADVDKFCPAVASGQMHECLREHRKELSDSCRKEELLLEELEVENVELRQGIVKACTDERSIFCKGVATGQARVFRCLAEKMGDADFGVTCRNEITNKLQRRQANWKLDPSLRKACRVDVSEQCATQDAKNGEDGEVYTCLIHTYDKLAPGCQKELGRAVHMAFYVWTPGAILTHDCDADIEKLCLPGRPSMPKMPGAIGACLAAILEGNAPGKAAAAASAVPGEIVAPATLSLACHALADVAEPPNIKAAFDASLSFALLQSQLSALESSTGLPMMSRDRSGAPRAVALTGWTALAGIMALVVVVAWGALYGLARYRGGQVGDDFQLVVKGVAPPAPGGSNGKAPAGPSRGGKAGHAPTRPRP